MAQAIYCVTYHLIQINTLVHTVHSDRQQKHPPHSKLKNEVVLEDYALQSCVLNDI